MPYVRVQVSDKDLFSRHDLIGSGLTDKDGYFVVAYDQSWFEDFLVFDKAPDLFVKGYG